MSKEKSNVSNLADYKASKEKVKLLLASPEFDKEMAREALQGIVTAVESLEVGLFELYNITNKSFKRHRY